MNVDARSQRFILKPARKIHDDLTARQPSLACTVNIGVSDLPHAQIAAHIHVPIAEIGVDLIVVAHAVGRECPRGERKVNATWNGFIGIVINHGNMNPVASSGLRVPPVLAAFRRRLFPPHRPI